MTRSAWLRSQTPLSQPATVGRRSQVIDRWIHTACLCFGLDLDEQRRSGFGYAAVMEDAFDTIVDRTRTRLDVPRPRTLFGVAGREPERTLVGVLSGSGRQPQ